MGRLSKLDYVRSLALFSIDFLLDYLEISKLSSMEHTSLYALSEKVTEKVEQIKLTPEGESGLSSLARDLTVSSSTLSITLSLVLFENSLPPSSKFKGKEFYGNGAYPLKKFLSEAASKETRKSGSDFVSMFSNSLDISSPDILDLLIVLITISTIVGAEQLTVPLLLYLKEF